MLLFCVCLLMTIIAALGTLVFLPIRTKIKFMNYAGVFTLLRKSGLLGYMRPKHGILKTADGVETVSPSVVMEMAMEKASTMRVRDDDIFIATYPKAGTTWLQEITWLICNDADVAGADKEAVTSRVPFLETVDIDENFKGIDSLESWKDNGQRLIKTHLSFEMLPSDVKAGKKCKIVYLARNPKDVCVSYFHFYKMNYGMPEPGTWSQFLTKFCAGELAWGSWFDHTLGYWKRFQNGDGRVYFMTYENLKIDLRGELVGLAEFLGKKLTEEQLDLIAKRCTFQSMSENDKTNYSALAKASMDFSVAKFMRKGEVGDWKNHFTLNQDETFNDLYRGKMENSGLEIKFEL